MTSPAKIRAARALLDLSQSEVAELSSLSIPTVKRAESAAGLIRASPEAVEAITAALEKAGVEFIEDGANSRGRGEGVRLKK